MKYTIKNALIITTAMLFASCGQTNSTQGGENIEEKTNTETVDTDNETVNPETSNGEITNDENAVKIDKEEYIGQVDNSEEVTKTKNDISKLTKKIEDASIENEIKTKKIVIKNAVEEEVVKKLEPIEGLGIQTVSPTTFSKSYAGGKSVLIDVRTAKEFSDGHLPGAINIDYYGRYFKSKIATLDKNKAYSIYCRSGGRSYRAAKIMTKAGLPTVYNLDGGIKAWRRNSMPIE